MKEYKIEFNGKTETWIRSDEEMSFDEAQKWVEEKGGTEATPSDLWAVDSETQKPRWLLLNEEGENRWCWAGEHIKYVYFSYYVGLNDGFVGFKGRNTNSYALCRVGF